MKSLLALLIIVLLSASCVVERTIIIEQPTEPTAPVNPTEPITPTNPIEPTTPVSLPILGLKVYTVIPSLPINTTKEGVSVKFQLDMPDDYTFTKIEYGDGNWSDELVTMAHNYTRYKYINSGTFEIKAYASNGKEEISASSQIEIEPNVYKQVVAVQNIIPTKKSQGFVQTVYIKRDVFTSTTNERQHALVATQGNRVAVSGSSMTNPIRTYPIEGRFYKVKIGMSVYRGFTVGEEVEISYVIYGD